MDPHQRRCQAWPDGGISRFHGISSIQHSAQHCYTSAPWEKLTGISGEEPAGQHKACSQDSAQQLDCTRGNSAQHCFLHAAGDWLLSKGPTALQEACHPQTNRSVPKFSVQKHFHTPTAVDVAPEGMHNLIEGQQLVPLLRQALCCTAEDLCYVSPAGSCKLVPERFSARRVHQPNICHTSVLSGADQMSHLWCHNDKAAFRSYSATMKDRLVLLML